MDNNKNKDLDQALEKLQNRMHDLREKNIEDVVEDRLIRENREKQKNPLSRDPQKPETDMKPLRI